MSASASFRIPLTLRIPVPLLFLLCFALGACLQFLVTLPQLSAPISGYIHTMGLLLLLCGLFLILPCTDLFLRAHTPLYPHGAASALVVRGPYQLSRNPMYLSLLLTYVGSCAVSMQLGALILLPLPVVVLTRVVIPFEEARLTGKFGEQYQRYCRQVRRWL